MDLQYFKGKLHSARMAEKWLSRLGHFSDVEDELIEMENDLEEKIRQGGAKQRSKT